MACERLGVQIPTGPLGDDMAMALKQAAGTVLPREWENEITNLIKKYNLRIDESKALRGLSRKFQSSPRNVAITLQQNPIGEEVWYDSMKKQATTGKDRYKRIFGIASECMDYSIKPFKPKKDYEGLISKLSVQK